MSSPTDDPSDDVYREPILSFLIDLPVLLSIGKQFDAVMDAPWEAEPGTPWRELVAAHEPTDTEDEEEFDPMAARGTPRIGRYRIECGRRRETTPEQEQFFDWLRTHQDDVLQEIRPAVVGLFDETFKWRGGGATNAGDDSDMESSFLRTPTPTRSSIVSASNSWRSIQPAAICGSRWRPLTRGTTNTAAASYCATGSCGALVAGAT